MFPEAVDSALLLLAEDFFKEKKIASCFYMAGGTTLALHLGHRKSFDIDLFSETVFREDSITDIIVKKGGSVIAQENGTVYGTIETKKISFLHYPYSMLNPVIAKSNIKLASMEDIACMKVVSISQRAEKKDFYDMYEILKVLNPTALKEMFLKKYGIQRINCYHILRSFFFFGDVEETPDPISLNGTTWEQVKSFFIKQEKILTETLLSGC